MLTSNSTSPSRNASGIGGVLEGQGGLDCLRPLEDIFLRLLSYSGSIRLASSPMSLKECGYRSAHVLSQIPSLTMMRSRLIVQKRTTFVLLGGCMITLQSWAFRKRCSVLDKPVEKAINHSRQLDELLQFSIPAKSLLQISDMFFGSHAMTMGPRMTKW